MLTYLPRHIAICGNPNAGKTELQRQLARHFGVVPVDDGRCLRAAAKHLFGLTEAQVSTQEGKAEIVEVCGRQVQVRDLLGWLGECMENRFGDDFKPERAMAQTAEIYGAEDLCFSYGSVRKGQGRTFRERGGLVVGVRRLEATPSHYSFDRFDPGLVDIWIDNTGSKEDLLIDFLTALADLSAKRRSEIAWVGVETGEETNGASGLSRAGAVACLAALFVPWIVILVGLFVSQS